MTTHTFKVGDRVRIRQWDDMAEKFGIDEVGAITIYPFKFKDKHLCGREATIRCIFGCSLKLDDVSQVHGEIDDIFSAEMIELVKPIINHNNWISKNIICINGKEMPIEEFKATAKLYRSALSAYNNYFPVK